MNASDPPTCAGMRASSSYLLGIWCPDAPTRRDLTARQTVATMTDPRSGATEPVAAPLDGVVVMHRRTTSAAQGDLVVFLTQPDEGA